MKAIIISLFLFCTVNATNWYVDRDATGSNNGTSWTNAWIYFGGDGTPGIGIDWSVIGDGDTIFVSGGTDSTLYFPRFTGQPHYIQPMGNYTFEPEVVICRAWQSGHNGEVYLGQKEPNGMQIFQIGGLSGVVNGVKVTGFTMVDLRDNPVSSGALVSMWGERGTIDNCHIIGKGYAQFIGIAGYKNSFTNNIVEDQWNEFTFGQDMIGAGIGRGDFTITGNLMIVRNNYTMVDGTANSAVTTTNTSLTDTRLNEPTNYHTPGITIHCNGKTMLVTSNSGSTFYGTGGWSGGGNSGNGQAWYMEGAHRDGIQFSACDGALAGDKCLNIVANNMFIDQGTKGTGWNSMVYTSDPHVDATFLIYNNILCNKEEISSGGIFMYEYYNDDYITVIKLFNNTIINKGDGRLTNGEYTTGGAYTIGQIDTLIMKNNLAVIDTGAKYILSDGYPPILYKQIDYNIYAHDGYNAESFAYNNGIVRTWDSWLAQGFDAHSDTMRADNVIFENKYGYLATDYRTTTGQGQGVNLSAEYPFLRYDILGNDRGSSWDIGAVQYVGSPPSGINVKGKVFLQGPFSTNSMSTNLNQSSLLPNSQPYNTPPWNYNGNESFTSGPNSTMVDWVLVELRSASNPAQVVARRAAVLNNNGLLLNTSGSEGVDFNNVDPGSYYIAIYHRNHLAIMSATPVSLSSNSAPYDFTTAMNKAYGQNPMVELVAGKFGMYATDGNADGTVNTADRDEVWLIQNGNMGYLEGDFNMNSGVTVHDVNQLWNINNGAVTRVP